MTERASDLPGLLVDAGIRLKRAMTPGSTHKVICPKCHGGNDKEPSLSLHIDDDGQGATWNCKRATCGYKDGGRVEGANGGRRDAPPPRKVVPPPAVDPRAQDRGDGLYGWWAKRGVSRETVDAFGLYLTRRHFPDPIGATVAMVFPYVVAGQVVNRKFRPPQKNPQLQEKDALPALYNVDSVTAPDRVIWVEGEPDCLAVHEAGYPQVVSLPNGAPAENVQNDDRRYEPLGTHAELLEKVERFYLAGDMDAPGLRLREELARRLGRHRCWLVTWPEGRKDANDVLLMHTKDGQTEAEREEALKLGRAEIAQAIESAEPYPIEGMHRVTEDVLLALRRKKKPPTMSTGVGVLDQIIRLPSDGRLIVVLGIPNHGKTPFVRHIAVHTMENHGRRWAVFSPEMRPWERFAASCAEWLTGKRFYPAVGGDADMFAAEETMTDAELAWAARWLRPRLVMLVNDAEKQPPTIDWILDMAKAAVMRDGITDLWLDPWNELSHLRPAGLREDEYIGQSLQRLLAFSARHGCNCWVNVHPITLRPRPGEKATAPGSYDIAGGAMFFNKADVMLTVYRPAENPLTKIIIRKTKDYEWGRRGDEVEIAFNTRNGRYSTPAG